MSKGIGYPGEHAYCVHLGTTWMCQDKRGTSVPAQVLEDGIPLTIPDCCHAEIADKGAGRYSLWGGFLYFSTSDNSDPRTNGRTYDLYWPKLPSPLLVWMSYAPATLRKFLQRRRTHFAKTAWTVYRRLPAPLREHAGTVWCSINDATRRKSTVFFLRSIWRYFCWDTAYRACFCLVSHGLFKRAAKPVHGEKRQEQCRGVADEGDSGRCSDTFSFCPESRPAKEQGTAALTIRHYAPSMGPGGAERQIVYLAHEQHKRGHAVGVLCWDLSADWQRHYIPPLEGLGIPVEQPGPADKGYFKEQSLPPNLREKIPPDIYEPVCRLAGRLRKDPPDLLHCWLDMGNCIGGWAGILAGVPRIVLSIRSVNPMSACYERFHRPWWRQTYRLLCSHPSVRILSNSAAGAHDYAQWLGMPDKRIALVRNGFDFDNMPLPSPEERLRFRRSLGIADNAPVAAGVFRLSVEKNPLIFLEVIARVRNRIPELRVVHAGDSNDDWLARFRRRSDELGLSEVITLLGRRNDVPLVLSSCDALLQCSEVEGLSNVIVEAQWYRCPPVTTPAGDMASIVIDGQTGHLRERDDIEGLAACLESLLSNRAVRDTMGQLGHEHVRQEFSIDRLVANTERVYCSDAQDQEETSTVTDRPKKPVIRTSVVDTAAVPINYLQRDAAAIEKDVAYAVQVGGNFAKRLSENGIALAGKTLLELGPGINFGDTLYLASLGARVMVADRFLAPWDEAYHPRFYARLAAWLKEHVPHADTSALDRIVACQGYTDDAILRFEATAEDLSVIADGTIDIVLSNAVLEHVMNPAHCFRELFRIMSHQGIQFHQVDFRDHRDFSRPLDFLLIGDGEYARLFREVNGERGNRWRPIEYETMMRQAGFSNISFHPSCYAEDVYLNEFMDKLPRARTSKYHSFSVNELRETSGCFILKQSKG
ncbi:MAG: glycosyltransferase [Syntrophales bacterium]